MLKKILIGLLVLLVIIQFIRPTRNNGVAAGPNDITHYVQVPDSVMNILKVSCYDCHSNNTNYPWYTNINPVGWWMQHHVNDGKHAINFSDLSQMPYKKLVHRMGDIGEQVEEHEMPLSSYLLIHTDAKLSEAQIQLLKNWSERAKAEVQAKPPVQ
jgi:hypothetical protein